MNWIPIAIIAALQCLDGWTTWQILKRGGQELNPLVRAVFSVLGRYFGLLAVKGGVVVLLAWMQLNGLFDSKYGLLILSCLAMFYMVVVASNLRQMRK